MKIVAQGTVNTGVAGTARAMATFASFVPLDDGTWLAGYRVGSTKDSDDEKIEFRRSIDEGVTWSKPELPFTAPTMDGASGTIRCAYCTDMGGGRLIVAAMWIDHTTYPGKPLFNEETEGCLPMKILIADSEDDGKSWSEFRQVHYPEDIGPPSLTNPIIRLPSGRLVLSVETNKNYLDTSKWLQRVVYSYSEDGGQTWGPPITTCQDPTARIFYWDQRAAVWPDGRLATFSWTYDRETTKYLNIQRRISSDEGATWSDTEDLGITDQASHPAVLSDGRVVFAWVDRFQSRSIRARAANGIDSPFTAESEVVLYQQEDTGSAEGGGDTGELLSEMGLWTFGLPYTAALPNGDAVVVYYQGTNTRMDCCWARLAVS